MSFQGNPVLRFYVRDSVTVDEKNEQNGVSSDGSTSSVVEIPAELSVTDRRKRKRKAYHYDIPTPVQIDHESNDQRENNIPPSCDANPQTEDQPDPQHPDPDQPVLQHTSEIAEVHHDPDSDSECKACEGSRHAEEWVACDRCNGWFHCICVEVTFSQAQTVERFSCGTCESPGPPKRLRIKHRSHSP
eukprot:TRINITY_DN13644_c0_g1_i4.p1 TRINITY_DN13644_c0_g1~~TRINITY_DN13644_c0_g1_i4.p1  ORF type:complete len:203 (-),score=19.43 TRINITY_DN13644_c0_g1_i4:59-622(-)